VGGGDEDLPMHFSAQRLADLALAGCMPHRTGISVWTLIDESCKQTWRSSENTQVVTQRFIFSVMRT